MTAYACIYHYDWDQEISDFKKSGLKMHDFCKDKGYPYTAFQYHYYKKRHEDEEKAASEFPVQFVPVVSSSEAEPAILNKDPVVRINGLDIVITDETDIKALKKVLQALEEI